MNWAMDHCVFGKDLLLEVKRLLPNIAVVQLSR